MRTVLTFIAITAFLSCSENKSQGTQITNSQKDSVVKTEISKPETSENESPDEFELMKTEKIGELQLGMADFEVTKIIGSPEIRSPFEVWGADGSEHSTWSYDSQGIELDMIKDYQGYIVINGITVFGPCTLSTSRGIKLGSFDTDVIEKYKKEITTPADENSITAGSSYGGVIFTLENNIVTRIFVGAAAE